MAKDGTKRGRRPGSKNKATLNKEQALEALRAQVALEQEAMTAAQIANAKGINFLVIREKASGKFLRRVTDTEGEIKLNPEHEVAEIWAKDPSTPAYTDLMNRAVGKPVDVVEMEHSGGLTIKWQGE